ncbi:MAG: flagellar assembly protein FliH [Paraglaciecola sp.]|nr:flagellar assembly protein FliH [Paraglaciecola sp.]NCT46590.1 flagellar assembly protein FliH [Paraglaciecola sp.]
MSAGSDANVKSWELPHIEKNQSAKENAKTDVFNRRHDWKYEPPEEDIEVLPPTAEEIEAIRAQAHAEGFAQGQQEGHEAGRLAGHQEGLEQGLAEGKEQGHAQGIAAAQEQIAENTASLVALISHLQKPVSKVDKVLERELVTLAVSLARAVIRSEVKTNENLIFQALSEGLKVLPIQESSYQIYLHPEDINLIQTHFSADEITRQAWNLIENPSMARGGCEIITQSNAVDVSIERRVRDVLDRFLLEQGLKQIKPSDDD